MVINKERKFRKFVMSELADLYLRANCISRADKQINFHYYFGINFNITASCAYTWGVRGFPSSRKEEILSVFRKFDLAFSEEQLNMIFKKKKEPAYKRGENIYLLDIYEKVREKGYTSYHVAKFLGVGNSTFIRYIREYGGLPREYIDAFSLFLKKINLKVSDIALQKCIYQK